MKIPLQSTMIEVLEQPLFEEGGLKFMERFREIYQQGTLDVMEIWVDTETGVNYVFHRNGNAAGFTPLLDKDGKPVVTLP